MAIELLDTPEHDGLAVDERIAAFDLGRENQEKLHKLAPAVLKSIDWVAAPLENTLIELERREKMRKAVIAESVRLYKRWVEHRLTQPIDEKWLRSNAALGNWVFDNDVPTFLMAAILAECNERIALLAVADVSVPDEIAARMGLLNRVSMMESELVVGRVDRIRRKIEKENMAQHATNFQHSIANMVANVSEQSRSVRALANATTLSTNDLLEDASTIAVAAEQSAGAMASAAENSSELVTTVEQAKLAVDQVSSSSAEAADEASNAANVIRQLNENTKAIESVVGLIRDVAGQTNLLALNATIEAARAGEAGRGFAVVAQEVKALASQTSRATDDIVQQITQMQHSAEQTASANAVIADKIGQVTRSTDLFENAMESQGGRLVMVANMVDETAMTATSMSGTVASIRKTSERVASDAEKVDIAFSGVDNQITQLEKAVAKFLGDIAA